VASGGGYLERPLGDFLDDVASPEPLPGSGFVAATAVAMAAGLVSMAARLSQEHWPEGKGAAAQAEILRARLASLAMQNAEAYAHAVSVLEGGENADPRTRDDEIARALAKAAQIPLQIGEAAADVSALAATVAEHGEPSLRADAAAAALIAQAGARAAATLVEVNLGTTAADDRIAQARAVVAAATESSDRALDAVA
jgi:formiminotetrahydrofolate cyclodeaminase